MLAGKSKKGSVIIRAGLFLSQPDLPALDLEGAVVSLFFLAFWFFSFFYYYLDLGHMEMQGF